MNQVTKGRPAVGRFDGRRLSWLRLALLVSCLAVVAFVSVSGWRWFEDNRAAASVRTWFAAYVDVTVTPRFEFEQPTSEAARDVVLAFVVAGRHDDEPCTPMWGGSYTLDAAASDLDLDRRIARLRQNGGEIIVSFGGAAHDELAVTCTDEKRLEEAYAEVIDRYDVDTIDLDLEGRGLTDTRANARRASAVRALQVERRRDDHALQVWLTLPASPQGLTAAGQSAVMTMLDEHVEVTGVNVMTMNFGTGGQSMARATASALDATHRQLTSLYSEAGIPIPSATLWKKLGATPMIGQNDTPRDVFGLDAARALNAFARENGMGRLSMWSLNRDRTCSENYPDVRVVSNSCSGVEQRKETFASLLHRDLGSEPTPDAELTPSTASPGTGTTDDPRSSPYPIWQDHEVYVENTRVVWHRNVYVAKWWTTGDLPDDPTVDAGSSPWQLVGPVLPGEKPLPVPTVPPGTYPTWDADTVYTRGERVLLDGVAYSAKWWTQGDSPTAPSTRDDPSPWMAVSEADLRKLAGG